MNITQDQIKILKKYKIDYTKYDDISDLLDIINDKMVSYTDENDEPTDEFIELQNIYDSIYINNQ